MRSAPVLIAAALALALQALPASATSNRTTVSGSGTDSGSCAITAPCRSFAYAMSQTSPGGQILILDSAGYGPFTITQALTIIPGNGAVAIINAPSGNGITVNAGPTDLVIVSGIHLDGLGTGTNGIQVNSAGSFSLSGANVSGFANDGLVFTPGNSTTSNLTVQGSSFYKNGGDAMLIQPGGSTNVNALVRTTSIASTGINIDGTSSSGFVHTLVDQSQIRYMSGNGVVANGPSTGGVRVQISNSLLFALNNGLVANGTNVSINLYNTSASNITTVVSASNSGVVNSYGDNGVGFFVTLGPLGTTSLH